MAAQPTVTTHHQPSLFHQIEEVLRHSFQERPLVLLLVVAPAVFIITVALSLRVLPMAVAVPVAIVATMPGTAIAWCSGVLASKSWEQASKTLGQLIRTQLQKSRRIALFEAETPLYVDWYVTLRLAEELQRSKRYGSPLSVLTLTPAGQTAHDRNGLVEGLQHTLRSSDIAGAMPDDRVVIVLPNAGLAQARRVRARFQPIAERFGYVIGVAEQTPETSSGDELIQRAAEAARKRPKRKRKQELAA